MSADRDVTRIIRSWLHEDAHEDAVRALEGDGGLRFTASHNPPQDNGYKVYLGDGTQIVPPADAEISAEIEAVGPLASVPRADGWTTLGEDVLDAYISRVVGLLDPNSPRDLRITYTPLHGVGRDVVLAAFDRAGDGRRLRSRPDR